MHSYRLHWANHPDESCNTLHPVVSDALASNGLPTAVVDVRLQLSTDVAGHPVTEPCGAHHGIVSPLIQEELSPVTQSYVYLAVLVDVGRVAETATVPVQVENSALPNVDKDAYVAVAPASNWLVRIF